MKHKKVGVEIAGWYGVLAILSAFALVSFLVIEPDGLPYQALNVSGSIGIIISSISKRDYQPVALNIAWLLIAAVALLNAAL